ncbi:bactofilin family protein [Oceanibacterium hippocampi]|uniref:Polymer-forming cytoskeletal n=1 Tax=Oceanibacterium hippocampi TaxID=745714 RepID=A0A1Y5RYF4_9PROT|nr:Polymer-forming cytoskeletal [Oceanibacterium hippocampi]
MVTPQRNTPYHPDVPAARPRESVPSRPGVAAPTPVGSSAASGESTPQASDAAGSKLIVGPDIHLKGEITSCDRLIVEGRVEASMDSRIIEIAESGIFNGTVEIDTADISGLFEGSLTARQKLVIRSTGRVRGTIRYGEITIEPGGQIAGEVEVVGAAASKTAAKDSKAADDNGSTAKDEQASLRPSKRAEQSGGGSGKTENGSDEQAGANLI